ncbi:MAG: GntR family transcriptional regulator [Spirochaetales bacterium]|nr:GntR family transcriptional regulator [Spirochaetales bacterium]
MNFKQDRAIYLQIADYITEHILSGDWREGDRLPSVRELAVSIEVNPNTVMHTYNYLQEKGIVYNQRGIGYFIAGEALQSTRKLGREAFFHEQLPRMLKSMILLDIDIAELKKMYKEYKSARLHKDGQEDGASEKTRPASEEKT